MKRILALLFSMLIVTAAVGCQGKPQAGITDFLGNPVELQKYPERIISLTPTNTEIVYALGLEGRLVGVDSYSDYPAAAKDIAKVGDFNKPNTGHPGAEARPRARGQQAAEGRHRQDQGAGRQHRGDGGDILRGRL